MRNHSETWDSSGARKSRKTRNNNNPDLLRAPTVPSSAGRSGTCFSAMANNENGSRESILILSNAEGETDRAFYEQQLAEHARLKKIFNFFRKKDDLDASIHQVVDFILSIEPAQGVSPFEVQDVSDMVDSFCTLNEVLNPEFFRRTTFPFRMLRLSLDLHLSDPVEDSMISNVRMTHDEERDQGLKQLIWFLLFVGALPEQVETNLAQYRDLKSNARASSAVNMAVAPTRMSSGDRPSSTHPPLSAKMRGKDVNLALMRLTVNPSGVLSHVRPPQPAPMTVTSRAREAMQSIHTSKTDVFQVLPNSL